MTAPIVGAIASGSQLGAAAGLHVRSPRLAAGTKTLSNCSGFPGRMRRKRTTSIFAYICVTQAVTRPCNGGETPVLNRRNRCWQLETNEPCLEQANQLSLETKIRNLRAEGKTYGEIAEILHVSIAEISRTLNGPGQKGERTTSQQGELASKIFQFLEKGMTRARKVAGPTGFEPATCGLRVRRSSLTEPRARLCHTNDLKFFLLTLPVSSSARASMHG